MIYPLIKSVLLFLLKGPTGPPEAPAGSPASVQIFRASPRYLRYQLVLLALFMMTLILGAGALAIAVQLEQGLTSVSPIWVLPAILPLFGLPAWFLIRLEYDLRYYVLTDRSLRIREGVWTINEITLTYANVQHLEIRQGPIQQMLGIADVVVRTAGGGAPATPDGQGQPTGHRGMLRGIENAQAIRDQITALLRRYRHAGLGDPEERHALAAAPTRLSPLALARLREIRDELRSWRRPGPPPTGSYYDPERRP
jgi:membrane protein YdbS with pleckstrin-like domain